MKNFEHGHYEQDPSYDPERLEGDAERSAEKEPSVDLRHESELFADHERIDNAKDIDTQLARLRDTLSEDKDGVIHLTIPAYDYDFATNPFVGMGPHVVRTYEISRHLDVVFLHRFMYQNILVCGIRSREFVGEKGRAAFVRHAVQTGGVRVVADEHVDYDFAAVLFAPFAQWHTTAAFFTLYHKQMPHVAERPHYPIDVWLIYDADAYREVEAVDFRRGYRLREGYDRRSTLLGVAQIN